MSRAEGVLHVLAASMRVGPGRRPRGGCACNLCHGSMSQDETRISEEEARALWHRAAELQAEAARRLEERSRQLAPRGHPSDTAEVEGYRLADVRAAAEEAGISPEFVDHALAEARNRTLVEGAQARPSAMAARFLGQPPLTLEISRVIHAPAEEVYGAMQRILPKDPFRLSLIEQHGADPLDGGVLVFKVPAYLATLGDQSFAYEMAWIDLKQLLFSLRRLDTDPPATELTVRREPDPQPQAQYVGRGRLLGVGRVVERCRWRLCGRERGRRPRDRGYRSRRGGIGLPCWWSSGRRAGDAGLARVVSLRVAPRGEGDREPDRLDSRRHRDRWRLFEPEASSEPLLGAVPPKSASNGALAAGRGHELHSWTRKWLQHSPEPQGRYASGS